MTFCHVHKFLGGIKNVQIRENQFSMTPPPEPSLPTSDENVEQIRDLVRDDQRLTMQSLGVMIAEYRNTKHTASRTGTTNKPLNM